MLEGRRGIRCGDVLWMVGLGNHSVTMTLSVVTGMQGVNLSGEGRTHCYIASSQRLERLAAGCRCYHGVRAYDTPTSRTKRGTDTRARAYLPVSFRQGLR